MISHLDVCLLNEYKDQFDFSVTTLSLPDSSKTDVHLYTVNGIYLCACANRDCVESFFFINSL